MSYDHLKYIVGELSCRAISPVFLPEVPVGSFAWLAKTELSNFLVFLKWGREVWGWGGPPGRLAIPLFQSQKFELLSGWGLAG